MNALRTLILGIGIDDALHLLHHVKRHPERSLLECLAESGKAVLLTTVTTVLAFLPMWAIGGLPGKVAWNVPAVVVLALLIALLGAFFIATDPVSGCTSTRGRLVFGAGAGLLTLVIRRWGAYPDGVAFAVLLMNMAAPVIDHYTQPRTYGHAPREKP